MQYIIKHDLSHALAKKAAEKAAEHYTAKWQKYETETTWLSDSQAEITFCVKGMSVVGLNFYRVSELPPSPRRAWRAERTRSKILGSR